MHSNLIINVPTTINAIDNNLGLLYYHQKNTSLTCKIVGVAKKKIQNVSGFQKITKKDFLNVYAYKNSG